MVQEIAFDVNIDCHEFIEVEDWQDGEELAQKMLEDDRFYHYILDQLRCELNSMPYIEAVCVDYDSNHMPTIKAPKED